MSGCRIVEKISGNIRRVVIASADVTELPLSERGRVSRLLLKSRVQSVAVRIVKGELGQTQNVIETGFGNLVSHVVLHGETEIRVNGVSRDKPSLPYGKIAVEIEPSVEMHVPRSRFDDGKRSEGIGDVADRELSGRRRPVVKPDSEFLLDVDTVIMSLGTSPNPLIRSTTPGLETNRKGCLIVNENEMTTRDGVFAGGDAVTGAATVILAMGAGKKAAAAIDKYLQDK